MQPSQEMDIDSDVDPDPQNLIKPIRIQVNKITKLILKHLFRVKRKNIIFKSERKPRH